MNNAYLANESQALKALLLDAVYFKDIVVQVNKLPEQGMIINGLMSELTMFVIESYDTLVKINPKFKLSFETQNIEQLRNMRHRAKLLEYAQDINDGVANLDGINTSQVDRFQSDYKGWLSQLKKLIQPDLGLTKYRGHFITTTHSTLFELGISDLPEREYGYNIGEIVGRYLQTLFNIFNLNESVTCQNSKVNPNKYQLIDIKSNKLFKRSSFSTKNKRFSPSLILILMRLNYTRLIMPQLLPKSSESLIRIKFINTYHALKSLQKIQSIIMKGQPSELEAYFFKGIFGNKEAKWLLKQLSLRNVFVHYLLDDKQLKKMPLTFTREDVLYRLSGNMGLEEMQRQLDIVIENITLKIEVFFNLKKDTFRLNHIEF